MSRFTQKLVGASLFLLTLLCLSTQFAFGQCGTYFRPEYRALNKQRISNGAYFRLDDWTGDGKRDYWNLRPNGAGTAAEVIIYPARPAGYWDWNAPIFYATSLASSTGLFRQYPKVLDFDGDGRPDLLVASKIHRNNGSGVLEPQAPITVSDSHLMSNLWDFGYYDMDGDHRLDWVYTFLRNDGGPREIRYQPGMADGSFGNRVIVLGGDPILENSSAGIGDVDGDGRPDAMIQTSTGPGGNFTVIKNLGGGSFQRGPATAFDASGYGFVQEMNGDGRADIVTSFEGDFTILYGQADATFSRTRFSGISYGGYAWARDLNGDGRLDMLIEDGYVGGGGYTRYDTIINDGSGGYVKTAYGRHPKMPTLAVALEDVTGDGRADMFENAAGALDGSLGYLTTTNTFGETVLGVYKNTCQPAAASLATFSNDNEADVVTWNGAAGNWSSKNWGTGSTNPTVFHWGASGDIPAPADLDGDGVVDYTIYRESTGAWYSFLSGSSSLYGIVFGLPGDKPVPNDYDGDGKADVAVFRPSTSDWHFWYSSTQSYGGMHFGADGDKPVPADYDGDLRTDVAVYRPSAGYWYVLRSSDQNVSFIPWGIDTDIPVPLDLDADGKADPTVFRSGIWYILRSTNNSVNAIYYGLAGDVPVPFYRNGLMSDVVLYRSSDRRFYDRSFMAPVQLGGPGDVPVRFGLPNN